MSKRPATGYVFTMKQQMDMKYIFSREAARRPTICLYMYQVGAYHVERLGVVHRVPVERLA